MLYLGIDQPARQLAISLRDDNDDVIQARQVSTRPEKIHAFFTKLTRERLRDGESFIAVVEVCGFNDWLIKMMAAQARVYAVAYCASATTCKMADSRQVCQLLGSGILGFRVIAG